MHAQHALNYELIPYTAESPLLLDAVRVYTKVWPQRHYGESLDFFSRYARYPGFYGCVARHSDADEVIAMGFGTLSEPGQWWHDKVAEHVGRDHLALQSAWVLVELGVLSGYRSTGVGSGLHDHLLDAQPCRNALLSTQADNRGARRFYERHGWTLLHPGFPFFDGHAPYCIYHKRLRKAH